MRIACFLTSLAVFSAVPVLTHAGNSQCDSKNRVSVSGRVTTLNISPTRQAGQICMTLTNASGKEVFDQCGAILGEVVSANRDTGQSTLNHTILFGKEQGLTTQNDVAQITGVQAVDATGMPCAFSMVEKITRISWANGTLRSGPANITAAGSVSSCPDKNLNTFTLSGSACIKESDDKESKETDDDKESDDKD